MTEFNNNTANTVKKPFDLIAIGTGVAASTVAWQCHSEGWSVAVIDSRPFGMLCCQWFVNQI
jgi:pyruvate/2-oxoglutarate dehydrogenase complex dihydrolipoamide dehydrogenase (E3) component